MIKLTDVIAKSFYQAYHDIKDHAYTHYWFSGGRGSTKSSFISIMIILELMKHEGVNAIIFRKVGDTLRDSVFSQMLWAIGLLGVASYFQVKVNPMSITYKANGNKILFRGVDDPLKIKSIKANQGYFAYIWFEELAEFNGMDEINNILQSVMRGGEKFYCLYSYNPPERVSSWVNVEAVADREDKRRYHSTYLDVPKAWLGDAFLIEAEHLKSRNESKYNWQYLGEPTGTGGEVFSNVQALSMSDEMIDQFDNIKAGLDFGWVDPTAYVEYHKDKTKRALYIYHEFYAPKANNEKIAKHIKSRNLPCVVTADCANTRDIAELRNSYGIRITGCTKNRYTRERTIKHLSEYIEAIYIDPNRCPNAYREFTGYELERDKHGNFKSTYPDGNDHTIDAVRYGEDDINYTKPKTRYGNIY